MKSIKIISALVFILAMVPTTTTHTAPDPIEKQINQLRTMLAESNDVYIYRTTPTYKQYLTSDWIISYFWPLRLFNNGYFYNSEVVLNESQKIATLIVAMEKIQEYEKRNK